MKNKDLLQTRKEVKKGIFILLKCIFNLLHLICSIILTPLSFMIWIFNEEKFKDTWLDVGIAPLGFIIAVIFLLGEEY